MVEFGTKRGNNLESLNEREEAFKMLDEELSMEESQGSLLINEKEPKKESL